MSENVPLPNVQCCGVSIVRETDMPEQENQDFISQIKYKSQLVDGLDLCISNSSQDEWSGAVIS
jgi:hypothetical protein